MILVALRHIDRYANVTARKECYVVLFVCGRSELRDTKDQPILSNDRERAKEKMREIQLFLNAFGLFFFGHQIGFIIYLYAGLLGDIFFSLNIMGRGYISPITDLDDVNGCLPQTAGGKFLSENIFFLSLFMINLSPCIS